MPTTKLNTATVDAMDKDLLRVAQQGLRITDVALRQSRSELADRFEPKYEHPDMDVQLMQRTARSQVLEARDGDDGEHKLFQVFVDFGIRWVRRPPKPRGRKRTVSDTEKAKAEPEVLGVIEATFIAEYEMKQAVEKTALDEFALHNVPWNLWPYWREYVASQSMRLNLPKVAMPLQCLAPKQPELSQEPVQQK